jgi:ketosteroid isomerase-like protein
VTGKRKSGNEIDLWFRTALGFRRADGRWFILNEHSSAPFDPACGSASLALELAQVTDHEQ